MNAKFFDVNKEKQDSIINASLKLFAQKGYKDASTDVIVKAAGISKGLLFHYFGSKQGLYNFICDYSSKYMTLELTRSVKSTEKDFFAIMSQIETGKARVARNYPYMHQFLRSLKFEKDPEAIEAMGKSKDYLDTTYDNIYAQISTKKFINPEDSQKVIEIIQWINDGYTKEKLLEGNDNSDEISEGFSEYLSILRKHFYMSDVNETISVAKEEVKERDETIMDGMKMDMTFEERLLAGKRPLVDIPEGEETEAKEDTADSNSSDKKEDKSDDDKKSSEEKVSEKKDRPESIDDIIEEANENLVKQGNNAE